MKYSVKKIISLVLVLAISMVMSIPAFATTSNNKNVELKIQELYNEKAQLLCDKTVDQNKLDRIDTQLESLGVEFLKPEEVQTRFPDISKDKQYGPYVVTPVQDNVSWSSYKSAATADDGNIYEVQHLVAQPNSKASNLKETGNYALRSSYNWKAGSMNILQTAASAGIGEIPGAGVVLSIYDAVKGFVSGISKTTVIEDADIVYSWSQTTTAVFSYVKPNGASDNEQSLTYISTKVNAAIGYQFPTFIYTNTSGGSVSVSPNVIQGKRSITATPSGYDSTPNAIRAYLNTGNQTRATVDSIQITGIESDTVAYIYPVSPAFPAHIG